VVLAVDDDDAFAQVLDDVVVELDEVAQVDASLLGKRLALHEPRAQQLHDGSDDEDDGAENADGRELRARRDALQLRIGLLAEQNECRDGREQQCALRREQQRKRSDGHDQHAAHAARDAAARVDQQRDGHEVGRKLQIRLPARARHALLQQDQKDAARREQADQCPPCERFVGLADDAGRVDQVEDGQQDRADRQAEQVQQTEDAPGEVGRDRRIGCWTRRRFRALRVDGIDGGHGAEFYLNALAHPRGARFAGVRCFVENTAARRLVETVFQCQ
jgi:hypothetical protein